jgi:hypothetical protein
VLIAQVNDVTRQRDELEAERDQYRDEWRKATQTLPIQNEPYLGLATTEELFREIISRFTVGADSLYMIKVAVQVSEILGGLSPKQRAYRTVDGD